MRLTAMKSSLKMTVDLNNRVDPQWLSGGKCGCGRCLTGGWCADADVKLIFSFRRE